MVFTVGLTVGLLTFEVKPIGFEVQEYPLPETWEPPITILFPLQTCVFVPILAPGGAIKVTSIVSMALQPY